MWKGDFLFPFFRLFLILTFLASSFSFLSCEKGKVSDDTTKIEEGTFENGDRYVIMRSFEENLPNQKTVRFFCFWS